MTAQRSRQRDEPEPAPPRDVPGPSVELTRSAWWWIRAAAILGTIFLAIQLLGVVQSVLGAVVNVMLYVLFGSVLALILSPSVDLLSERLRLPRTAAILVTFLAAALVVTGIGYLVSAPIVAEAKQLSTQGPSIIRNINNVLNSIRDAVAQVGIHISGASLSTNITSDLAGKIAGTVLTVVSLALDTLISVVVAFWLLKDGIALRAGLVSLLPGRARSEADFFFDAVVVVVGGYLRAQLFLAVIIGVLAGAGALLIGVPYPIVVGLATATFELVPLVGPFLGGGFALVLALTKDPQTALFTAILFVVIHVIEGYLLAPRIQARFVRLHPLVTLLALVGGIEVGGFLGAFIAVPVASLVAVFVRAAIGDARSRHPELWKDARQDPYLDRRRRRLLGDFRLFGRRRPTTGQSKS